MNTRTRLPHAVLDQPSRILKAKKIIALLGEDRFRTARRILEIGCGSGVIASTLASLGSPGLEVHAVDVVDNRLVDSNFTFTLVDGTTLPFDSSSFDIVISNHVIEHVGDPRAQLHHLAEIGRVMKESASTYLAVPNKWRLVEPHYRLPLLSWLPLRLADAYVRFTRRGTHYDCRPLSHQEAITLFHEAGFVCRDMTIEAVDATLRIEHGNTATGNLVRKLLPPLVVRTLRPVISTLIFTIAKPIR